jgi:hypothetical protein
MKRGRCNSICRASVYRSLRHGGLVLFLNNYRLKRCRFNLVAGLAARRVLRS